MNQKIETTFAKYCEYRAHKKNIQRLNVEAKKLGLEIMDTMATMTEEEMQEYTDKCEEFCKND